MAVSCVSFSVSRPSRALLPYRVGVELGLSGDGDWACDWARRSRNLADADAAAAAPGSVSWRFPASFSSHCLPSLLPSLARVCRLSCLTFVTGDPGRCRRVSFPVVAVWLVVWSGLVWQRVVRHIVTQHTTHTPMPTPMPMPCRRRRRGNSRRPAPHHMDREIRRGALLLPPFLTAQFPRNPQQLAPRSGAT